MKFLNTEPVNTSFFLTLKGEKVHVSRLFLLMSTDFLSICHEKAPVTALAGLPGPLLTLTSERKGRERREENEEESILQS